MVEKGFANIPRGRARRGARSLAGYILGDEEEADSVYNLPREEFGLMILNGQLTGFEGWIDVALERRIGKKRRRRQHEAADTNPHG
jgi:hypothetical protein